MIARSRVRILSGLLMAALVAACLAGVSTLPAAEAAPLAQTTTAKAATSAVAPKPAAKRALSARARAGQKAGRKAGAAAGAKAGRKAAAMAGKKAAAVGEKAGRKAGAAAGAKAGRLAGSKGGAKAGRKAGTKAGAKAGTAAGVQAARNAPEDCGPTTYRKNDGTAWKCTLGDDFDGASLDTTIWRVMTSDRFSYGNRPDCFVNDRDNVSVSNGTLNLTARREASAFTCVRDGRPVRLQYTAGMVSTYEKFNQAYGRFEFRAKFPYTLQRGIQASFWLWPKGETGRSWPASGEIDIAEWYSHYPDRVIPYLHHGNLFSQKDSTNNYCLVDRVQNWHTYLLEWSPTQLKISYDGVTCLTRKGGAPFNKAYMISMFQGFGLEKNAPTASTPGVNRTQVDWVRVWS